MCVNRSEAVAIFRPIIQTPNQLQAICYSNVFPGDSSHHRWALAGTRKEGKMFLFKSWEICGTLTPVCLKTASCSHFLSGRRHRVSLKFTFGQQVWEPCVVMFSVPKSSINSCQCANHFLPSDAVAATIKVHGTVWSWEPHFNGPNSTQESRRMAQHGGVTESLFGGSSSGEQWLRYPWPKIIFLFGQRHFPISMKLLGLCTCQNQQLRSTRVTDVTAFKKAKRTLVKLTNTSRSEAKHDTTFGDFQETHSGSSAGTGACCFCRHWCHRGTETTHP